MCEGISDISMRKGIPDLRYASSGMTIVDNGAASGMTGREVTSLIKSKHIYSLNSLSVCGEGILFLLFSNALYRVRTVFYAIPATCQNTGVKWNILIGVIRFLVSVRGDS